MRNTNLGRLVACAALAIIPATFATHASAQALPPTSPPQIAPTLVPALSVDLMTADGAAALGANWKTMEARIVEGPALQGAMPGYKSSYDISPHAGQKGFDDSSWAAIDAMQKANSIDPKVYRPVLKTISFPGITGTIAFDSTGALKNASSTMYQVKSGAWVPTVTKSGT